METENLKPYETLITNETSTSFDYTFKYKVVVFDDVNDITVNGTSPIEGKPMFLEKFKDSIIGSSLV